MRLLVMMVLISVLVSACGRDQAETGEALYAENCAICHGVDARGGGGGGVEGLSKTPPDLTGLALRNGGQFPATAVLGVLEVYRTDGHRAPQMAGFSALQSDEKQRLRLDGTRLKTTPPLAALLVYLESVQMR